MAVGSERADHGREEGVGGQVQSLDGGGAMSFVDVLITMSFVACGGDLGPVTVEGAEDEIRGGRDGRWRRWGRRRGG